MKVILFFSFVLLHVNSIAQDISAKYTVDKLIEVTGESFEENKTVQLNYNGFLYKKGNTYISFLKPLYISEYSDGLINNVLGIAEVAVF